jgi:3-isopropylmalate/(R)-2-methylmalate dehydratase small subunit
VRPFIVHVGTAVPLRRTEVDTDQIIPARFCVTTTRDGHADALFADWRGKADFVLDRPERKGATVLIAGNNFGTGSSREFAVWALQDFGFRAVIAPKYGDIFYDNSLVNGLLVIRLPELAVEELQAATEEDATVSVEIDLVECRVRCRGKEYSFTVEPDARARLIAGVDLIEATLSHESLIGDYEKNRHPLLPTTMA